MAFEDFKQVARVDKDHRVVLTLPGVAEGTEVQVTVEPRNPKNGSDQPRKPGTAKGLLKIEPGFDDPLEGFEDYR